MKLRIHGDSLRFRLSQGEVSRLLAKEKISESVHFSSSTTDLLTYALEACDHSDEVSAHFENGKMLVTLPTRVIDSWANTNQVGIEYMKPIGEEASLRIVIEKDFRCLQPRPEEDESDNFPNPQETAVCANPEAN